MRLSIPETANDDAIAAIVDAYGRNIDAIDEMSAQDWTDEKAAALSDKSEAIALHLPELPADTMRGVCDKIKWLRRDENRHDMNKSDICDKVLFSVYDDIDRLA
ncbi:hypothetical protein [uncultured Sneathiella sp.]|uniref:hypothetical protein n=1 Tax=uncultured Sneathiella sp. TaxID=879315 RepID=UPI0030D7894B|tara:strand:- start:2448 stop:2759 length:312 start_codon:yes stop_codon:yes gene_type:complete